MRVDVRELHRLKLFGEPDAGEVRVGAQMWRFQVDDDSLRLGAPSGGATKWTTVAITWTPCHFGSRRPWFRCESCSSRVAVLFGRADWLWCRVCANVSYRSQRIDACGRSWKRQRSIERRLDVDGRRPRGMHAATYFSLVQAIRRCEEQRLIDLRRWLARRR